MGLKFHSLTLVKKSSLCTLQDSFAWVGGLKSSMLDSKLPCVTSGKIPTRYSCKPTLSCKASALHLGGGSIKVMTIILYRVQDPYEDWTEKYPQINWWWLLWIQHVGTRNISCQIWTILAAFCDMPPLTDRNAAPKNIPARKHFTSW